MLHASTIEVDADDVKQSILGINLYQSDKEPMDKITRQSPQLPANGNIKSRKKRRRYSKKNAISNGDGDAKSSMDVTSETVGENEGGRGAPPTVGNFPYPTDYNDHFETPARAYNDIFPLMEFILAKKRSRKTEPSEQHGSKSAIVYDPYYCAGRAAVLLREEFQRQNSRKISMKIHVQHEKRDFYRDIRQNTVPQYDILVTNPPYSENHKERCLDFAVNQLKKHGRSFFLLMPNYVATKEYFRKIILGDNGNEKSKKVQTFYIIPSAKHPYEYDHPDGTGHLVSPFASIWFCGLCWKDGNMNTKDVVDAFVQFHSLRAPSPTGAPKIVTTLQDLIQIGAVSGSRRKNPRQRKKMRSQAIERAGVGAIGGGGQHSIGAKRKSI